jgi:hypothetical protein
MPMHYDEPINKTSSTSLSSACGSFITIIISKICDYLCNIKGGLVVGVLTECHFGSLSQTLSKKPIDEVEEPWGIIGLIRVQGASI